MERRRSAPHDTGLVSAPAFAWGGGARDARANDDPDCRRLTSRKAWANDIGIEVHQQRAATGLRAPRSRSERPVRSQARVRRLRRRLHCQPQGRHLAPDPQGRALHSREPRASRRGRRGPDRRRRRWHPDPDPARVPRRGVRLTSRSSCPSPATTPSAISSCRRTSGCARTASACGCASSARRAWSSWAGARCRSTTAACPRWSRP